MKIHIGAYISLINPKCPKRHHLTFAFIPWHFRPTFISLRNDDEYFVIDLILCHWPVYQQCLYSYTRFVFNYEYFFILLSCKCSSCVLNKFLSWILWNFFLVSSLYLIFDASLKNVSLFNYKVWFVYSFRSCHLYHVAPCLLYADLFFLFFLLLWLLLEQLSNMYDCICFHQ